MDIQKKVESLKSGGLIQENLRPDLGMYIELGNEAWHDLFFGGAPKSIKKSGKLWWCGLDGPGWAWMGEFEHHNQVTLVDTSPFQAMSLHTGFFWMTILFDL